MMIIIKNNKTIAKDCVKIRLSHRQLLRGVIIVHKKQVEENSSATEII